MTYEISYDSGRKPFTPDLQRGVWSSPTDFIYVCLGFAFKTDLLGLTYFFLIQMGYTVVLPFLILAAVIIVPSMVIFMYLGQFSSTGFITALRITPLFKGIGFATLFINFILLAYYGVFATIPLLFLFNSFRPILPWSCEGSELWLNKSTTDISNFCNWTHSDDDVVNSPEILDTTEAGNSSENFNLNEYEEKVSYIPSILYFSTHFSNITSFADVKTEFSISWELVLCTLVIWSILALIFHRWYETAKLGRLLRHLFWVIIGLLMVCLVRFAFLPGAHMSFIHFLKPDPHRLAEASLGFPIAVFHAFSNGWGMLVALSSHNRFKTNIMRYSWIIFLGQMAINYGFALLTHMIGSHILNSVDIFYMAYVESHWVLYLVAGTALANMGWPNFWSIIYFLMLILGTLMVMITQLMTILTSVHDEYEALRRHKSEFRMALIGTLALCSIYFCSNHGLQFFSSLLTDTLFLQISISLVIVLGVLWIYGRERFQRDIEFMLGLPFATWKVYVLRVITPLGLLISLLVIVLAIIEHYPHKSVLDFVGVCMIFLPWILIPGYGIARILQTTGSCCERFKRFCRPTDWYPAEAEDRQRYEETLGNMDITYQLTEELEEVH